MRTRVKICGVTRVEDALMVAEAGADAIGLVFVPSSKRYVEIDQAAEIVAALPPFVTTVGLFLDAREQQIRETLKQVPLDLLQFHGDECPADCPTFGRPYIKSIGMQGNVNADAFMASYPDAQGYLLDANVQGQSGGTGHTFDWSKVPSSNKPIVLAGGLTPDNVAEAVEQTRVYAVDVSSGVESSPGIKDEQKVTTLIEEVRRVNGKN